MAPGKSDCFGYYAAGRKRHRAVQRAERALSYPDPFLTALGENQNVAEGLCASGDDYLTKPYDLEMLIARIEARLRSDANSRRYVCYGDLKLDTVSFIGYVNGSDILLTHRHIRPTPTVKSPEFRRPPTTETLRFWVRCCSYLSAC